MELLRAYLKQTKIFLIAFVFAVAASAAVVCLYQLPAEAVIYMAVLWLGAGAAAFLYGYVRYRQKVQTLCRVEKAPEVNLDRLDEHKGAVLNLSGATLTWNGVELELTRNELRILELLFSQAGRPVSRDAIMTKLWESDSFVDDNTLTVNITRLRKKLEAAGLVDFIITRKGLGYMV